jgi:cyclic pyranopterin phosphate synthase
MPEEGIKLLPRKHILTFEEIVDLVNVAVEMGIRKVRLTGGEPLVRSGITSLVYMLSKVAGIEDLSMTTNGQLLEHFARPLKDAGLHRVNVSLDTLDPVKYREITRGGEIENVLKGIRAAKEADLNPVKLNCVVFQSSYESDALKLKEFALSEGLQVRFIRQMDLETGNFSVVEGGEGGNCAACNRLRVTANGMVKPCLFSDYEFSVGILGAKGALLAALNVKPLKGCKNQTGKFYNIGG